MSLGIEEEKFWHLNPHKVDIYIDSYNLKVKREFELSNVVAHLQGQYVCEAIAATIGNMFKDKKTKAHEYPKKPYDFGNTNELSEESLQKQRDLFVAQFMIAQANFNLAKGIKRHVTDDESKGQE